MNFKKWTLLVAWWIIYIYIISICIYIHVSRVIFSLMDFFIKTAKSGDASQPNPRSRKSGIDWLQASERKGGLPLMVRKSGVHQLRLVVYPIILVKLARDLTRVLGPQKVAFWKGNPLISGKSRLVKYYNLARDYSQGFVHPRWFAGFLNHQQ